MIPQTQATASSCTAFLKRNQWQIVLIVTSALLFAQLCYAFMSTLFISKCEKATADDLRMYPPGSLSPVEQQHKDIFLNISATPFPSGAQLEMNEDHICLRQGLVGFLDPNALVTIVVTPKPMSKHTLSNSGGAIHLKHIMWSWAQLKNVNFVVMSSHCSVLLLAASLGLPSVQISSGSDVGDLTYRHALKVVESIAPTPLVGFSNSDIAYDESLVETARALMERQKQGQFDKFMMVGRRKNVDVPPSLFAELGQDVTPAIWHGILDYMRSHGDLFQTDAQDYFIFTKDLGVEWTKEIPPFIIGGVYFDNWFTSFIETRSGVQAVDATNSLRALHINHGNGDNKKSHSTVQSDINRCLGNLPGNGFVKGHTHLLSYMTSVNENGMVSVEKR